jgi:hypothetical protein
MARDDWDMLLRERPSHGPFHDVSLFISRHKRFFTALVVLVVVAAIVGAGVDLVVRSVHRSSHDRLSRQYAPEFWRAWGTWEGVGPKVKHSSWDPNGQDMGSWENHPSTLVSVTLYPASGYEDFEMWLGRQAGTPDVDIVLYDGGTGPDAVEPYAQVAIAHPRLRYIADYWGSEEGFYPGFTINVPMDSSRLPTAPHFLTDMRWKVVVYGHGDFDDARW